MNPDESKVIAVFKRYCRAISDKPEIWDKIAQELPGAIITDNARIMEESKESVLVALKNLSLTKLDEKQHGRAFETWLRIKTGELNHEKTPELIAEFNIFMGIRN